jgi:hypothetical protein
MLSNPAAARCVAGVGSGCSASRGDTTSRTPRLGRGTALGCVVRIGARACDLALGARRVDLVAGLEATTAGASRHGVNTFHLQQNARVDARLLTHAHARRQRAWVKITPRTQRAAAAFLAARLAGGLQWSSRGVRWPQPCVAHACLAFLARRSHLVTRGASRGEAAAHDVPCTARSARRPAITDGPRTATAGPGAWTARELHSIAVRQYCVSKAGNQARRRDDAPQRRRCQTEKKSRREERGRGPR